MAYRFKKDEAIPHAIQRVFAEEVSWAVGQLVRSKKRAQAVHEARKSIKKIRALLSLIGAKAQDKYFRNAARLLSDVRDETVMLQVFDSLSAKHPEADVTGIRNRMRAAVAEKDVSTEVVRLLKEAPALPAHFGELEPAMQKTYRRGRKAFKRAQKNKSEDSLHDFRKQVKQHWYQLRLFEKESTTQRLEQLRDLETWLGDEHNLSLLRERLKADAETAQDRQQLREVLSWIDAESQSLRDRALEAGPRLYTRKPPLEVVTVQAKSAVA